MLGMGETQSAAAAPLLLEFDNNRLLLQLLGEHDRHLALIEDRVGVACVARGNQIVITGGPEERQIAALVLRDLYRQLQAKRQVGKAEVEGAIRMALGTVSGERVYSIGDERVQVQLSRRRIAPRSPVQAHYIEALKRDDLVFGIGPAGTGKTYLAVAVAASMLAEGRVDRLVLSRPAVEAGERLGFLPGDMREKVDPYLRPLYDALHDMFTGDQIARKLESAEIEVAPLAFMRGRTLRNAFVILDEAQNCTPMQMKMFLTRLGENSRMAITGDPTQIDLPPGQKSGLNEAIDILHGVEGVSMLRFTDSDVVRHPMVARIVRAYEARAKIGERG
ncbi:MAG: phosphate starvation-inducible protein PhoH [Alphaproteobacteria bacterium]|nr:phosphate starvation-inducible protein PhoH [Alphaproteobacteria bacterium]